MRRTLPVTMLFLLVLLAPLHAQQWSAQRVLSIGEEEGTSFGKITGIAATANELYVLDGMESRVYVYDTKGRKLRTFDKRGAGPGELSNMPTHLVLWPNQLVIPDAMNRRVNLFGTDGKFVDSRPIDPMAGFPLCGAPSPTA
jgi:hypothetical protein